MEHDFLIEIGTEELPPKSLRKLSEQFSNNIEVALKESAIPYKSAQCFATPRRIAVLVEALATMQPDSERAITGPPVRASFDSDGKPTQAALGFAKKCATSVDQLERVNSDKGEKLAYRQCISGSPTRQLLPEILASSISKLPIPKPMRWSNLQIEFIRPVHWVLALYGNEILECKLLGQTAGRISYGHRFHAPGALEIEKPNEYAERLRNAGKVIVDFTERRNIIEGQLLDLARSVDGTLVDDPGLLDEVTALVEWPVALAGRFDEQFLRLPKEVLVSTMKGHQKYFPVYSPNGDLLPHFITVANIESQNPAEVISGNERVVRPRLSDAAFFFDSDKNRSLDSRREDLKAIIFQKKLGTIFDKVERISRLADHIAKGIELDAGAVTRASQLCKSDLITQMVGEFPDLQGTMGYYYAKSDGEIQTVSKAILEHYNPRFAGDKVPNSAEGSIIAIADKLDTITGLFAIGQPPSGDKDPFALRRAALGVLRICVENKLSVNLIDAISVALESYKKIGLNTDVQTEIVNFMFDRFRGWLVDKGIAADAFLAVQANKSANPWDFYQRVVAVDQFKTLPEASALAASNKRVANILAKSEELSDKNKVSAHLLKEPQEIELLNAISFKEIELAELLQENQYTEALNSLAQLRPVVDGFFDHVMVNVDAAEIRVNRLALLEKLRNLFLSIADIAVLN